MVSLPPMALLALAISGCGYSQHQPTVFERAQSVRLEIREGHFSRAEQQADEVLAQSHMGRWHFAPFAAFVAYAAAPSDKAFADRLNAWVGGNPKSPLAHLIRADYHYNLGWWIRGHGFADDVDSTRADRFQHELELAARDIDDVVQLAPDNPYARYLALLIARDTQSDAVQDATFRKGIARFPNYYPLYEVRLSALQPKWGGSTDAMKAFVQRYAAAAPSGSPLKMLHLKLYADLLGAASLDCRTYPGSDGRDGCVERAMGRLADGPATRDARDVIRTFARRDDANAVGEIEAALDAMVMAPGGGAFANRFLQSAADALHSDTQLAADKAGGNDYAIDRVASLVWYRQGNYANALTWGRRAIEDLPHTRFASEAEANDAKARTYRDLASTYARLGNYRQVAAYGEAAAKLSGGFGADPGFDRLSCEALFRLKRYPRALKVCSAIIDASEDRQARFFRARVYDAIRRDKEAIDDYQAVADSPASMAFRVYSALAISLIYDKENKFQDALDSMNGFADLFVAGRVTPPDLAAYYNNRCYDKMKLGHPKAALDDCDISLRYGNIPDALSKQQQLMDQLGIPSGSTLSHAEPRSGNSPR
jgi:tetratricopeptide (TPR) repeat protein